MKRFYTTVFSLLAVFATCLTIANAYAVTSDSCQSSLSLVIPASEFSLENTETLHLHSARLDMEPLTLRDFPNLLRLYSDSQVRAMSGDFFNSVQLGQMIQTSDKNLTQAMAAPDVFIALKISFEEEFVGVVQLYSADENLGLPALSLSIGYALKPQSWGHGFATEAARRIVRLAFDSFHAPYVHAKALHTNEGSIAVLRKLGLRPWAHWTSTTDSGSDYIQFILDSPYRAHSAQILQLQNSSTLSRRNSFSLTP